MIDLHPEEKIILIIRRHWLVFIGEILPLAIATLLIVVPILFSAQIFEYAREYLSEAQVASTITFISTAWILIIWIIFFLVFTDYYLDILIVTNQRIIDVEQKGMFARDIATAPLGSIQDVKIEILGIVATMFNFGNLHLQTAGGDKEIIIRGIKNPEHVKKLIMSTHQSEVVAEDQS
ncbi:MAG: hypothetical protein G01um101420_825 [Parcubacteria group bacterium Gr01-1014_20]|nr:MAG: hypothetical protein G01um101420_825 [Parcubacteria group bacterium Gr01-1014_20]